MNEKLTMNKKNTLTSLSFIIFVHEIRSWWGENLVIILSLMGSNNGKNAVTKMKEVQFYREGLPIEGNFSAYFSMVFEEELWFMLKR